MDFNSKRTLSLFNEDCMAQMKNIPDNTIDSIVTDPPYNIKFMDKKWDSTGIAFNVDMWKECYRVLKPGGYILVFGGTRTYHRIACAIEDAGFIIKDIIVYAYGTGFPKGQDVAKQIEAKLLTGSANTQNFKQLDGIKGTTSIGYNKMKVDNDCRPHNYNNQEYNQEVHFHTEEAKQWEDWNTQLKPSVELICVGQKPISEKTIAENVLKWGTGALNIGACRIAHNEPIKTTTRKPRSDESVFNDDSCGLKSENSTMASANPKGRFPANTILDEEAAKLVDMQSNSASRYFYCAKPTKKEKNLGCEHLPKGNNHTTVKGVNLMKYLVRLVTQPNGYCLDPFMGSGTTGIACVTQKFNFYGIEKEKDYFEIARCRIKAYMGEE